MNKHTTPFALSALTLALMTAPAMAAETTSSTDTETSSMAEMQQRMDALEARFEAQINALADELEASRSENTGKQVHFGGYGELHYRNLDDNGEDVRELDFHRWVLFIGYDFSDRMRLVSEFELEHAISPGSEGNGAVELEQAYIEYDLTGNMQLRGGIMLTPVGIINETHEPPTFYGVERPIIETTIIPTTWYVSGVMFSHQVGAGWSYDVMVSEGLKTDETDPYYLKGGKQKSSYADAFDLATTVRVNYRGLPGLELSGYAQYQPDIDQSARESYADSATLIGGHVIYQLGDFTTKALYARWDVNGDGAALAEQDVQEGGYVELSYKPGDSWGVFARQSGWTQTTDLMANQIDFGVNYYPHPDVVLKADYQIQNDDANDEDSLDGDGFNLGIGYQF